MPEEREPKANVYDYVPVRAFASDGDVRHWIWATGMSPWLIYPAIGYLVLWAVVDFYRVVLPRSLVASGIGTPTGRAVVLVTATAVLFAYFAIPGLLETDVVSQFIARTSLLLIQLVILVNWKHVVITAAPPHEHTGTPAEQPAAQPIVTRTAPELPSSGSSASPRAGGDQS